MIQEHDGSYGENIFKTLCSANGSWTDSPSWSWRASTRDPIYCLLSVWQPPATATVIGNCEIRGYERPTSFCSLWRGPSDVVWRLAREAFNGYFAVGPSCIVLYASSHPVWTGIAVICWPILSASGRYALALCTCADQLAAAWRGLWQTWHSPQYRYGAKFRTLRYLNLEGLVMSNHLTGDI